MRGGLAVALVMAMAVAAHAQMTLADGSVEGTGKSKVSPGGKGLVVPLPPPKPPDICGVQPTALRSFPVEFVGAFDGDTIGVKINLGFGITWGRKVRLLGVDTPEKFCRRGISEKGCEEQKAASKAATDFTVNFMKESTKGLFLAYYKDGKFGRALGVVCRNDDGKCINYELLVAKHAKYYCGEARQ